MIAPDDFELALREAGLDVRPLPRIPTPTSADLRIEIDRRSGPMLFPGLADGWRARITWNPTDLAAAHGHKTVTALMDLPANGTLLTRDQHSYSQKLTFADFLDRMVTTAPDRPCYLAYTRIDGLLPPSDYHFDELLDESSGETDTRAWIGSAGTRSMLHSDLKDNLFCQIWGEKRVVLIPWEYSRSAYPFPNNIVNSRIDLANVDLVRFPRLRSAVLYAGTLKPGDVLFMPRGCWHDMRSSTPSISLNHWFGTPMTFLDYAGLLLKLGPRHCIATAVDFVRYGLVGRREPTLFLFSPPSTGKRLYDGLRWGDFSRENDPVSDGGQKKASASADGRTRR